MTTPKPSLTEAQVADIVEMRAAKVPVQDIADVYGVCHMTIRRALEPGYNGVSIPVERLPELRKMYDAGDKLVAMSNHFGTSQTTVRKALTKLGLPPIRKRDAEMRGTVSIPSSGKLVGRRDEWKVRITDRPATLTAGLMGDPTPQHLQRVHGDKLEALT